MSSYLTRRLESIPNIEILLESEVTAVHGEHLLEGADVINRATGETRKLNVGALFVFIGADPNSEWLADKIAVDSKGFVLTGPDAAAHPKWQHTRPPYFLETTCPGVFAAGDIRSGSVKRVASGVGEGSMAVAFVHQVLERG